MKPDVGIRSLVRLVFFCFAGLNIFFSLCFIGRVLGLPSLVLISPFWDWSVWIISASSISWISLTTGSTSRGFQYLGLLTLTGTVVQVLPMLLPSYRPLIILSWLGEILVAAGVIMLTATCLKISERLFQIPFDRAVALLLRSFFSLVIPLQIWSITTILPLPRPQRFYPQFNLYANFDRSFQLLFPITVLLAALLVTEWLWFPLLSKAFGNKWRAHLDPDRTSIKDNGKLLHNHWRLALLLPVLVGMLVSTYQWFRGYPLGQDSRYYRAVLSGMDTSGIHTAFSTERPLLFLILYAIEKTFGVDPSTLLHLIQPALAIALVLTTYCFVISLSGREDIAVLAAVLSAVLPHVTVGVDIFITANWLGISLMLLFSYAFLRSIADRSVVWIFVTVVLSALTLGLHYFTWIFMMVVILCYLLLNLVKKSFADRREMIFQVSAVLGCIAVVCLAVLFAYWIGGGLLESLNLAENMVRMFLSQASPTNFIAFLSHQDRLYEYFGRKHYAIPLVYALALVGFTRLRYLRSEHHNLVRLWFVLSCLGLLMVQYNEWWRFLYMIPLEILAAFGLGTVLDCIGLDKRSSGVAVDNSEALRTGLLITMCFLFGLVLTYSTISSSIILLSLCGVVLMEIYYPSAKGAHGTTALLVTSLVLEQIARALYAMT